MAGITTIEEAFDFIQSVGICTIFSQKARGVQSLWDAVDLPHRTGGNTKWGAKMEAVWTWKSDLPALYPDDVYYGKIKGGVAVLMSMSYFKDTHYPANRRDISECKPLARQVFDIIRLSPGSSSEIRREAMERFGCTKSRFETALKELQITLNVVRENEPGNTRDRWLPFDEVYSGFED
ncbi:AlkZ-related protein [Pelagicoccus albus]|uniref:Uncharacterized protein n=1 Tax=Pelagicoccus albus TaxID=415222 RepID=A0A7X1E9X7_9BACT|nr:hypothetical protein [Pelagicoccus albus]MBC2606232.1 hypothetical protein [Pelagicoccus albus]